MRSFCQKKKPVENQEEVQSEEILKSVNYEKEGSGKFVTESEKGSDVEDITKPNLENELSLFQQETIKHIQEFRLARSQWKASKAKTTTSKTEIEKEIDDTNLYRGRCVLLRKLNFKTERLRNHAKTLRPFKYYTLKRKLFETDLPEIKEEDEVSVKILANALLSETNRFEENSEENSCINRKELESIIRASSRSAPCITGQTEVKTAKILSKKSGLSELYIFNQLNIKEPETAKTIWKELKELLPNGNKQKIMQDQDEKEVKPHKKIKWFWNGKNSKENKDKKKEAVKEKDSGKIKGLSKKAVENLKASKVKHKQFQSCKCINGKEVTVVIKGFCLCDKVNLKNLKIKNLCKDSGFENNSLVGATADKMPDAAPIKSPQMKGKKESKKTDSVEVYTKGISGKLKMPKCEEGLSENGGNKPEKINDLVYCKPKNKTEKNKGKNQESESLISLFNNKPEEPSDMALTTEQLHKLNRDSSNCVNP